MATIREFFGSDSWQKLRNLTLPEESSFCGVCAALGEATPFAAWMWRVAFCVTTLTWGFGLLAYLILWICIPEENKEKA